LAAPVNETGTRLPHRKRVPETEQNTEITNGYLELSHFNVSQRTPFSRALYPKDHTAGFPRNCCISWRRMHSRLARSATLREP
jgi:hypothetical protein